MWHTRCIQCTSCSALWDPNRVFFELESLTCLDCQSNCFICGSKSSMYPAIAGEKPFCLQCICCDIPCEICGDPIWHRLRPGLLQGISCFHYRSVLKQRAPHMRSFFYPAHHSFLALPEDRTSAVAEDSKTNKPMPPLPWGETGKYVPKTAGRISMGQKNARSSHKSTLRTSPGLKKENGIRLDSGRLRISAPILAEDSLGWNIPSEP